MEPDGLVGTPPSPRMFWGVVLGLLAAVAATGALLLPLSPTTLDLVMVVCWCAGVATFGRNFLERVPDFIRNPRNEGEEAEGEGAGGVLAGILLGAQALMAGPLTMLAFVFLDAPPNHTDDTGVPPGTGPVINASPITAALVLAQLLALLVTTLLLHRRSWKMARRLALAPPMPVPLVPGASGRVVAMVHDPTPVSVGGAPAAFALTSDVEELPGSDPNIEVHGFLNAGTFYLDVGGVGVEVDPRGVFWSGATKRQWKATAASGNPRTLTARALPVGSYVLVAGRVERGPGGYPRMVTTPEEPLVMARLSTPVDPAPALRASVARRRNTVILLTLITLAATGAAVALVSELPPLHLPPSDGD